MKYEWVAFTDGGCKEGVATIGGVVVNTATGDRVTFSKKVKGEGTNNIAELAAILYAMREVDTPPADTRIVINTDSQYAIGALTGVNRVRANYELIRKVLDYSKRFGEVEYRWVRGHNGHQGNTMADGLATEARRAV